MQSGLSAVVIQQTVKAAPSPGYRSRAAAPVAGSACWERGGLGQVGRGSSSSWAPSTIPAGCSPWVLFFQEVRQHIHQGNIEKASRGEGQDPHHRLLCREGQLVVSSGHCVPHPPARDTRQTLPQWQQGKGALWLVYLLSTTVHHSRTYSFRGLCTDGKAGPQKASQSCRKL